MASVASPGDITVPFIGTGETLCLDWSPTQSLLASGNSDGGVRLWEITQTSTVRAYPECHVWHAGRLGVNAICFSPNGKTIYSGGEDAAVRMWRIGQFLSGKTHPKIGYHHDGSSVTGVGYLATLNLVVSGGTDGKLKLWNTRHKEPVKVYDLGHGISALALHQDAVAVVTVDQRVHALDFSSGIPETVGWSEPSAVPIPEKRSCISWFPDKAGFAVGGADGSLGMHYPLLSPFYPRPATVWKGNTPVKSSWWIDPEYSVSSISFHDSALADLVIVHNNGVVDFWDKKFLHHIKRIAPYGIAPAMTCGAFNASGTLFAYARSELGDLQRRHEIRLHHVVETRPCRPHPPLPAGVLKGEKTQKVKVRMHEVFERPRPSAASPFFKPIREEHPHLYV